MGQFASAGPARHVSIRRAGVPLLWVQSMATGRMRPVPFVLTAA